MKLTDEQKNKLNAMRGDSEAFHGLYDDIIEERLKELDPEFFEEIKGLSEGIPFWYA